MRIVTMPIQSQGIITRDNVSVDVSAVVYLKVVDAVRSVVSIENVRVMATGGNALLARGQRPDAATQVRHIAAAAVALATIANKHDLLVRHGNGPQVGLLALKSETDVTLAQPYPLDAFVAQTQGTIGYWLTQAPCNAGARKPIVSLLTQTLRSATDARGLLVRLLLRSCLTVWAAEVDRTGQKSDGIAVRRRWFCRCAWADCRRCLRSVGARSTSSIRRRRAGALRELRLGGC